MNLHPTMEAADSTLAKMRLALDHHAIVSVTDRHGVITQANDRFCAISGYEREELIGRTHGILKSGRHGETLYRELWRTIASGQVWHGVICNRRKNGGYYWVKSTIVPLCDAQGTVQEYVSIRTDITDRLLAQAHSSLLTQVLDLTDQGVVIADRGGQVIYTNHAAASLLGHATSDLQGRSILDFVPPALKRRYLKRLNRITTCDFQWQGKVPLLRADGSHMISSSHVGVVANHEGMPAFIFNIFSDCSDEMARQAALRAAKQSAEQASAAKTAVLSNISHELRTPLNAILGFGQLLSKDLTQPRQAGFAREILFAGQHLMSLINGILDLAQIESGQDVMTLETVDLVDQVQACLSLLHPLACDKQISVINTMLAPAWVRADRLRVRQVLLNLLSNAIKYSHASGYVKLEQVEAPEGRIRLAITDRGYGIPPEQMSELFKPFNRLGARARGIEGTGIGLAICKKLLDNMDGHIGVHSVESQGSTFWIDLPAASSCENTAPTSAWAS